MNSYNNLKVNTWRKAKPALEEVEWWDDGWIPTLWKGKDGVGLETEWLLMLGKMELESTIDFKSSSLDGEWWMTWTWAATCNTPQDVQTDGDLSSFNFQWRPLENFDILGKTCHITEVNSKIESSLCKYLWVASWHGLEVNMHGFVFWGWTTTVKQPPQLSSDGKRSILLREYVYVSNMMQHMSTVL